MIAALALVVGLYGLHRLALWAEERGFIYYLHKRGSSGALASAFLELQAIHEPGKRYVAAETRREKVEAQESGAPPSEPTNRSNVITNPGE